MAKPRRDDGPGLLGEPPEEVRVTVTMLPGRGAPLLRNQLQRVATHLRRRSVIVASVGLLAASAIMTISSRGGIARGVRGQPRATGAAQVVARCSAAHVRLHRPSSSWAGFDDAVWCVRYGGRAAANNYRFVGGALPAFG